MGYGDSGIKTVPKFSFEEAEKLYKEYSRKYGEVIIPKHSSMMLPVYSEKLGKFVNFEELLGDVE